MSRQQRKCPSSYLCKHSFYEITFLVTANWTKIGTCPLLARGFQEEYYNRVRSTKTLARAFLVNGLMGMEQVSVASINSRFSESEDPRI
jgi:hypothetical protein